MDQTAIALATFVHGIDPRLAALFGVPLYHYGLAYALGFAGVYAWFSIRRRALGWSAAETVELSILFAAAVLVFGRAFEIAVYEWDYYARHAGQLLSWWRGGMASHGVLLGALLGPWAFCRLRKRPLWLVLDELVVPGALFLALGRIGNFVNGEIIGTVTGAWWGVKFPAAEGFRHPVTLYESAKNFVVLGILLCVRRKVKPGDGRLLGHFVLWYGLLRIFTDVFRQYGKELLGIGRGQYFNAAMALAGLVLLALAARARRAGKAPLPSPPAGPPVTWRLWLKRAAFAGILLFSLAIPSSWTKGSLPARPAAAARSPALPPTAPSRIQ